MKDKSKTNSFSKVNWICFKTGPKVGWIGFNKCGLLECWTVGFSLTDWPVQKDFNYSYFGTKIKLSTILNWRMKDNQKEHLGIQRILIELQLDQGSELEKVKVFKLSKKINPNFICVIKEHKSWQLCIWIRCAKDYWNLCVLVTWSEKISAFNLSYKRRLSLGLNGQRPQRKKLPLRFSRLYYRMQGRRDHSLSKLSCEEQMLVNHIKQS